MTDKQVDELLTLLQAEYPNSFSSLDERMMAVKRNLWIKEFSADDKTLVYTAVRLFMKSGGAFAPTIGEIRQKMAALTTVEAEIPEQTAWALVSKACANGLYRYKEEFAKLPPEVQRAVGAPEQLKAWAAMDADTVGSVVASNFMRNYRSQQTRERELAVLPPEMRQMIGNIADSMKKIGDGENERPMQRLP